MLLKIISFIWNFQWSETSVNWGYEAKDISGIYTNKYYLCIKLCVLTYLIIYFIWFKMQNVITCIFNRIIKLYIILEYVKYTVESFKDNILKLINI